MEEDFSFLDTSGLADELLWLEPEDLQPAARAAHHVPTYRFDIYHRADHSLVGQISLKVGYNENIFYIGHIGYEIFPEHRGHRHALRACRILLPLARRHGLERVIITCNPDNIPSIRTIERLGAHFLETVTVPPTAEVFRFGARRKRRYELLL